MRERNYAVILAVVVLIVALWQPIDRVEIGGSIPIVGDGGPEDWEAEISSTNFAWIDYFGTYYGIEHANAIDSDASGVYIAGTTSASMVPGVQFGGYDCYVRKYNVDGDVLWTTQFGSSKSDEIMDIMVYGECLYVCGYAFGSILNQPYLWGPDAFVASLDANDGSINWLREFGTLWSEYAICVFASLEGVFVGGHTDAALPGETHLGDFDLFVKEYSHAGLDCGHKQFGTPGRDHMREMTGYYLTKFTNLWIVAVTDDALPGYANLGVGYDILLFEYSNFHDVIWKSQQYGTDGSDYPYGISRDDLGMLYIVGRTTGSFPGFTNHGFYDAFVQKLNPFPPQKPVPPLPIMIEWTDQFGTSESDYCYDLDLGGNRIYIVAGTGNDGLSGPQFHIRSYSQSGDLEWSHQYSGPLHFSTSCISYTTDGLYISGGIVGLRHGIPGAVKIINFIGKFCPYQDISASPNPIEFGEVDVWDSATCEVTISNEGILPLSIDEISLSSSVDGYYSIESCPILPTTLGNGETTVVSILYHPWEAGEHTTTLEIDSNDPDGILSIDISATAITSEDPPEDQIEDTQDYIDDQVDDGSLVGTGGGNSADERLNDLVAKFDEALALIEDGEIEDAIGTLKGILKKCDGKPNPPDHVEGEAAKELAARIQSLIDMLEEDP